jgi:hypothetical protein
MKSCLSPRSRLTPRLTALLVLTAVLWLPACDSFEKNAYRSLKLAKVEYELLQEHAARAYLDGRLTEEQWNGFAVAGNRFIAAHTFAADLMKTYQQTRRAGEAPAEEKRDRLEAIAHQVSAALAQLPLLLADLRVLLASFDPPDPVERPGIPCCRVGQGLVPCRALFRCPTALSCLSCAPVRPCKTRQPPVDQERPRASS